MENRCERCGRKLSDPQATYGWRCAEKMGLGDVLVNAPYEIFAKYTEGMEKAEKMFGNTFANSPKKLNDIITLSVASDIWKDLDNSKSEKAKNMLFKKILEKILLILSLISKMK